MPKIYLSPAYHKWNSCAISGCDETTHNNLYMDELEPFLKACKIDYKRGTRRVPKSNEDGTTLMNKAIKESNSWGADIHYVSHTNASNGTVRGCRPMIYPTNNPQGERLAEIITKYRKEIYDGPIIIKRTSEWAEIRLTNAVAYYEEHVFHDNYEDAKWFHDNMRAIARQTCKGFCEYFGIPFVDPYANTVGKEYKLVTSVNRYPTAADAQAKTNAKGTYEAGTYYIYNKYPNGLNGVYNISTDKTGASAGSWINPAENVVVEQPKQEEPVAELYRVRTKWTDVKSQKGAFSNLENAKACCQAAGEGYNVFNSKGKVVYSYNAPVVEEPTKPEEVIPETPNPEVIITAVYDLDYPVKTKIVDKTIGRTNADCTKAIKYILANNSAFDVEIAKAFFKLAPKYGIDPVMAISQSILETGWFKYVGSAVTAEQHNYCGLGVTSNGVAGGAFDTIEDGVTAQLQHLFAYGSKDALPNDETVLDPRFKYVTRGIAPYWQNLAGRWAVPGYDKNTYSTPEAAMKAENTYGQKILSIANKLLATEVTDADIEKYFKVETPKVETETNVAPVKPIEPEQPNDTELKNNASFVFDFLAKFIKAMISFFNNFKH